MIKTKITIEEELKRIQSLLMEQTSGTEPQNKCITIEHEGNFKAAGSDTDQAFKEFVLKVKGKLKSEFPKQQEDGNPVFITKITIKAGASNHYNGESTSYDVENDRATEIVGGPNKKDSGYLNNVGYASDRASNFLQNLLKQQENLIVKIPSSVMEKAEETKVTKVINTGGENDKNRDKNKYKNPGQYVKISMTVCQAPQNETKTKTEEKYDGDTIKEQISSCFEDAQIIIKYDGDGHSCNHALYEIKANGVVLVRDDGKNLASLNNTGGRFDNAEKIRAKNGAKKGRKNTFKLQINGDNNTFFNGDTPHKYKGDLVIEAACKRTLRSNSIKITKEFTSRGWQDVTEYDDEGPWKSTSDCHKWVGTIDVYIKDPAGKYLPAEKVKVGAMETPNTFDEYVKVTSHKACRKAVASTQ